MFPTNRETWKRIDGYANYEVSNFGRVSNATTERILKGSIASHGYLTVGLCKNGKQKTHCVHVLVAREWVDNPDSKRCVDHIDGDKTNNHFDNLDVIFGKATLRAKTSRSCSSMLNVAMITKTN